MINTMNEKNRQQISKGFYVLSILIPVLFSILTFKVISDEKQKKAEQELFYKNILFKHEINKYIWQMKAALIIKGMSRSLTNSDIRIIVETAWDQSEVYYLPADLILASASIETGFNHDYVGKDGEKSLVQFMPATYRDITGQELTDERIRDNKHIVEQYYKLMALYIYTFYDIEKAFAAYNCGYRLLRVIPEMDRFKNIVYIRKGMPVYSDRLIKEYERMVNYNY